MSLLLSFGWHQSFFLRSPLKTKLCPSWKHVAVLLLGGNKEMSTWFMCHMISSTIAGENKRKKWLAHQHCIVCCFDKQAFFLQMKEMCHLFWNSQRFHHFVCPSAPAFVSPTLPLKSFLRGRGLHCIFLYLSFSLLFSLCHSPYSESRAWPLSLFPHEDFHSEYKKAGAANLDGSHKLLHF